MNFDEASNSSTWSLPASLAPSASFPSNTFTSPSITATQCQEMATNFARWYFQVWRRREAFAKAAPAPPCSY